MGALLIRVVMFVLFESSFVIQLRLLNITDHQIKGLQGLIARVGVSKVT